MEDALKDYREAQEAGHHVDCDGFRTSHRTVLVPTDWGGFGARCEECGWQTTGTFGTREIANQFASLHTTENGEEIRCDGRCKHWH